ncbi:hypothetical protein LABALGNA3A7_09890 [Dellaglioa algida]|nr:hypothetical protein LABALGNA3A7_09890 [Dellaglioa algida]
MADKYALELLLEAHDLTRYRVSKISGIQQSTLKDAVARPINTLSVKTIQALSMATGQTAGQALDELLKLEGNPIVNFIQAHPWLDKELVTAVENLLIKAHESGLNLKTVTFNRYYDEGSDTNERAEQALKNLQTQLTDMIDELK